MAAGQKWFECQGYTRPSNRFKQLKAGDYVVFGAAGRREASGIFRLESGATRGVRLEESLDGVIAEHFGPRMAVELLPELRGYLEEKGFVDYLPFEEVWDLRPLHINCSDVFARLKATSPLQVSSLVYLQSPHDLEETMSMFLNEHRETLVHRRSEFGRAFENNA
jgi:hypothetical protein